LYYCHYTTSKSKYGCSLCNQKNTNCCSILNVFQIDGLIADIFIKPPNAFITLFAYDGLEIKDNISSFMQKDTKHKEVDIYDCLKSYFNDIVFDGDNKYFCDTCNQYNKAVKTISLKKYPMILIVQLNRQNNYQVTSTNVIKNMFSQNVKNDTLVKYSDYIYFGENENKYKYELYAVVIHTLIYHCVWHYICYCKSTINNNWTLFNDNKVNEVSDINEIIDKDACLLFYKRMT
jgi:ubiquitin C-terminal hydrolase